MYLCCPDSGGSRYIPGEVVSYAVDKGPGDWRTDHKLALWSRPECWETFLASTKIGTGLLRSSVTEYYKLGETQQ